MSVASKNWEREEIISEEQSSEMSKSESDSCSPSSNNIPKAKSNNLLLSQSVFKEKNQVFRGSFVNPNPPEIFVKGPNVKAGKISIHKGSYPENQGNLSPFNYNLEFFNKSFRMVVEKRDTEKIQMRSSVGGRRKTSHFGSNYNFLSGQKPKITRKNVIKR